MAAVLALVSSLLWGSADFGGGLASRRLPPIVVVAWTQTAALLGLSVLVLATRAWAGPVGWMGWAAVAGSLGALGLLSFYSALSSGTMGVVSPVAALGVLVPVIAGLVTGDRPSRVQLIGMLIALLGAVAAGGPELRRTSQTAGKSVLLAASAGLCFGMALFAMTRGAAHNPVMTMFGMRVTSVTGFAVCALVLRRVGDVRRADLPLLVAVGVSDASANVLFGVASRMGMVSVVAMLGALYPVATVLLARFVLHERMARVQQLGVTAALTGVVLLAAG